MFNLFRLRGSLRFLGVEGLRLTLRYSGRHAETYLVAEPAAEKLHKALDEKLKPAISDPKPHTQNLHS